VEQLMENLEAVRLEIPEAVLTDLDSLFPPTGRLSSLS
jgi:hypothetical protein